MLLRKDLADYPDILINEEKQRLKTERESLLQAKARIEAELAALPVVDPAQVEVALQELAKPWQRSGYPISNPEFWQPANFKSSFRERASVAEALENSKNDRYLTRLGKVIAALVPDKLTDAQAHLLRETLMKLNCRIIVKDHAIFITGKLPLGLGLSKVVQ